MEADLNLEESIALRPRPQIQKSVTIGCRTLRAWTQKKVSPRMLSQRCTRARCISNVLSRLRIIFVSCTFGSFTCNCSVTSELDYRSLRSSKSMMIVCEEKLARFSPAFAHPPDTCNVLSLYSCFRRDVFSTKAHG